MPYACRTLACLPTGKPWSAAAMQLAKVWNVASGVCLRTFPSENWECDLVIRGFLAGWKTWLYRLWHHQAVESCKWCSQMEVGGKWLGACRRMAAIRPGVFAGWQDLGHRDITMSQVLGLLTPVRGLICMPVAITCIRSPRAKWKNGGHGRCRSSDKTVKILTNGTVNPNQACKPSPDQAFSSLRVGSIHHQAGIPFTMLAPTGWRGFGKSSGLNRRIYLSGSQDMNQGNPSGQMLHDVQYKVLPLISSMPVHWMMHWNRQRNGTRPLESRLKRRHYGTAPRYHIRGITGNYSAYGYTYISETDHDNWVTMVNTGSHAGKALLIEMGRSTDDPLGLEPVQQRKMIDSFKMVE